MKQMKRKIISLVLTVIMICTMLPVTAFAADAAKVGDQTYATLDEAVEKAPEGSTIELLRDCELTKGFNKTLTFTGTGKITINKQLTSNGEGWMCFGLYDSSRELTFDGVGVEVEWISEVGTAPWLMLSLSGTLNVTNGAKVAFTVDSGATGSRNAIYMNEGSKINVTNGSTFIINGNETKGKEGQGIQLDKAGTAKINVTGGSTFLIDGTNRGYVNSPVIYVNDSAFTVQNCTANGSNGGEFTAVDSTITYVNNNGHGLSVGKATFENSVVNCNNNAYYGFSDSGNMTADATSVIIANGNGYGYTGGGIRSYGETTVESGAVINVKDNKHNGMENYGDFTIQDGAKLVVTGNNEPSTNGGGIFNGGTMTINTTDVDIRENYAKQTGGGICNAGTLTIQNAEGIKLYNNHAGTAGDDIYNRAEATFTNLPKIASKWALDGDPDCEHVIDGWYDDAEGMRWEAHAETEKSNHIEKYLDSTISGLKALKAAHGTEAIDKASYPGLDKQIGGDDPDETSVSAGANVNFKLISNVPEDLTNYLEPETPEDPIASVSVWANGFEAEENSGVYHLAFHDEMDANLILNEESIKVTIGGKELEHGIDYEVSVPGDRDGCTFEILMDLVKLYEKEYFTQEEFGEAEIIVTYSATAAEEIQPGVYRNDAWVEYEGDESEKDTVLVHTYGIDIFKYDQATGNGLKGAEFELKGEDGTVIEDGIVSGEDGHILIDGLAAGKYYLTETKAPEGYVQSEKPLEITITIRPGDEYGASHVIETKFANSNIPHTGGTGTRMYTIGGAAIIAAAGVLLVVSRRKKEDK